ncbi:MAG: hybrid sensor histidine kinase/response regulator, partial [Planctomycetota bacterium]
VDDDADFLKSLEFFLPEEINSPSAPIYYRFIFMSDPTEALRTLRELAEARETVAMVICDQKMPQMKGTELLAEVKRICQGAIRVLLTGHAGMESAVIAINQHLLDKYLTKPIEDENDFLLSIRHLLQRFHMERTIEEQNRVLAEANSRLEILDRLKTDFLTFISHELRTPLQQMSVVELIDGNSTPQEQEEMLKAIRNGYERLAEFVFKGLEYFDWLAREQVVSSETVDVAEVAREVAGGVPELSSPETDFALSAPETPCLVHMDRSELVETVRVLLDNAIKFSRAPRWIRAEVSRTSSSIMLTVRDRGIGFPPDMAREILRPFTVAHARSYAQGFALNLARAGAIVGRQGGRILAESAGEGEGAAFSVELPLALAGPSTSGEAGMRLAA